MRHEKKVWPEYFQSILDGKKKYELRLADWECSAADVLVLREWDPVAQKYTGRVLEKKVTHVLTTKGADKFWPKKEIERHGFQVISFE